MSLSCTAGLAFAVGPLLRGAARPAGCRRSRPRRDPDGRGPASRPRPRTAPATPRPARCPARRTGLNTSRVAQVDDRVADLPDQPQRPGQPGGQRQQRPGDAAQSRGGAAAAPQQHAEQQADHGEGEPQCLPGRGVDAVHPPSLRPGVQDDDGARARHPRPRLRRRRRLRPAGAVEALRRTTTTPTGCTPRRSRCCSTPGCWCRSSRCSARWSTTSSGLAHDKTSDMATVLMRGRDGRTRCWRSPAPRRCSAGTRRRDRSRCRRPGRRGRRPGRRGARCWSTSPGPVLFVVETDDLAELAQGHVLVEVAGEAASAATGG